MITPELISNRYKVEYTLGQGGMAVVYQVRDISTDQKLALKQLQVNPEKHAYMSALFEREFHTLVYLAHPRVVEVFDYGLDDHGPFYTMELLDGGDLRELSPMPWQKVCSILHDICSSLSLIHSRGQVHRDLSPRNVRCTSDGHAKLIDFGAMAPMGYNKKIVGTPSYTAPEVVNLQPLDARADLYSLGATAYFTLTGRHAYQARNFDRLRDMWRSEPLPPSYFVKDIPKNLDQLVLSLISLDARARPQNAALVMEHLNAIAGLKSAEQLAVSQSYLTTPTLVGRDESLTQIRKQIVCSTNGTGGTVLIQGPAGVGRSRFLDDCVLGGKISGAVVVRADASDAQSGGYGVVRSIAAQLLETVPNDSLRLARSRASVLVHVIPEIGEHLAALDTEPLEPYIPDDPRLLRPSIQAALREWLIRLSDRQSLMIAVDDVHRIDEPSAALLAALSYEANKHHLVVVVTIETGASANAPSALHMLEQAGLNIILQDLTAEQVAQVLYSVFGNVPNIQLLTDRIYKLSEGNPRSCMELAQYLVDKGVVRYEEGSWILPNEFNVGDLPSTLQDALETRLSTLSNNSWDIAQILAVSDEGAFTWQQFQHLIQQKDSQVVFDALDELVAAKVFVTDGESYSFRQQGWIEILTQHISEEQNHRWHIRLAELYEKEGAASHRIIHHLLHGAEEQQAIDLLLENIDEYFSNERAAYAITMGASETLELALELCIKRGRPARDLFALRQQLIARGLSEDPSLYYKYAPLVLEQLRKDTGLVFWDQLLKEIVDPSACLQQVLKLVQQQYESTTEHDRVLNPMEAIKALVRFVSSSSGLAAHMQDHDLFLSLGPLLEPFVSLSPAIEFFSRMIPPLHDLHSGRYQSFVLAVASMFERMEQPDGAGMEEITRKRVTLGFWFALGGFQSRLGLLTALDYAEKLDSDPSFRVNAWDVRTTTYLLQGDIEQAQRCRKQAELLKIQNSPRQAYAGTHWINELPGYTICEDLQGIKRGIEAFTKMAEQHPGWISWLHFANAEYHRVIGDLKTAEAEIQAALVLSKPGVDLNFCDIAASNIAILSGLERYEDARIFGLKALETSQQEQLYYYSHLVSRELALVEAKLGDYEAATHHLNAEIDAMQRREITGVNLWRLWEACLQISIWKRDEQAFQTYTELVGEHYLRTENPLLVARYEKIMDEARRNKMDIVTKYKLATAFSEQKALTRYAVAMLLSECQSASERSQQGLKILIEQSTAIDGYLYIVSPNGPTLAASHEGHKPPAALDQAVKDFLFNELQENDDATRTITGIDRTQDETSGWTTLEDEEYRVLLMGSQCQDGYVITAIAALLKSPVQDLVVPWKIISEISDAILKAGDVEPIYIVK